MVRVGEEKLPSNHFWILKRALAVSISNQMKSFEVFTTTNDHLKLSIRCISGQNEVYGVSTLQSLWMLKRTLEHLISNQISPFWRHYDHLFYIYITCPQEITYSPCLEGSGRVVSLKDIISGLFNYVEQNESQNLMGCVWGNGGREKGVVALELLVIIMKGTSPFDFQSNELFSKFSRQQSTSDEF